MIQISIITTTFNASEYILETLTCILNQTYREIEFILVDDGSTDDTVSLVQTFCNQHPELKIFIYPIAHAGRAKALCHGVSKANFDWIAIIDADDLWNKYKLETQAYIVEKNNCDFLATQATLFAASSEVNLDTKLKASKESLKPIRIPVTKLLLNNPISHSSILAKKNILNYDINRSSQIDYELWLRLTCLQQPLFLLTVPLTYHRIHENQCFESKSIKYALSSIKLQMKYCLSSYQFLPISYLLVKAGYYLFLPRKARLLIRAFVQRIGLLNLLSPN